MRQEQNLDVPSPGASVILFLLVPLFLKYFLKGTKHLVSELWGLVIFISLGKCQEIKVLPLGKLVGSQFDHLCPMHPDTGIL